MKRLFVIIITAILGIAFAGCNRDPGLYTGGLSSIHKGSQGMDISHWSYPVDFTRSYAAGIRFVYMKCGGASLNGSYYIQDPEFSQANIRAARDAGLKTGAYWFKNPEVGGKNSINDAIAEADLFYSYIQNTLGNGDLGDLYPVLDFENPNGGILSITNDQAYLWIKAFSDEFKAKSGIRQIILYTAYYTIDPLAPAGSELTYYGTGIAALMPLWLAATCPASYNFTKFGGYEDWVILQYQTEVPGYGSAGGVDLDDADLAAITISAGP